MSQATDTLRNPQGLPSGPSEPSSKRRSARSIVVVLLSLFGLTALDLATKGWAEQTLSRPRLGRLPPVCVPDGSGYIPPQRLRKESIPIVHGFLELEYAENCGAAFGLLRNAPEGLRKGLFGIAAVLAVGMLLYLFIQGRGGPLFAWSVPLVASGALGNLIDRIRYGYVVDFIHVFYEPWNFDYPTFNVADILITIGVILLMIDSFRSEPQASPKLAAQALAERV